MDEIDELLAEILVDAFGDAEQLTSFEVAFQESGRFPFPGRIVGTLVDVLRIEYQGGERRGLTAICRRDEQKHAVSLADLTPGPTTLATSKLLSAYRRWCGAPPLRPEMPTDDSRLWIYRRLATRQIKLSSPLALKPEGWWNPTDQYCGEEDTELDPLIEKIIAAGPRPEFEMEQVIPGTGSDDWDLDPVGHAAELHQAGQDRAATSILNDLITQDERCIDAWVDLGNIAFDAKGPKVALDLYDTAVAIGEESLPDEFNGALPRGLIDNRPFLRGLHGSFEDAHAHCGRFFDWYNDEHRHSGIGFHTPADVHYGRAEGIRARRAVILRDAYETHPERFVRKPPEPPPLPTVAWINEPKEDDTTTQRFR